MTSKHTPGNWRVTIDDRIETHYHSNGNGKMVSPEAASHQTTKTICKIERGLLRNVLNEEERANANLIAAAPDMFEALLECIKVYEDTRAAQPTGHLWTDPNHIFHARNAIKKAHRKEAHNG